MIPTYNQASFITKAVESALAQDYPNTIIVVADDCSSDETQAVLANYIQSDKIRYHRNVTNIGRVANYSYCLYQLAETDWVINLDGDDYFTNNHFISAAIEAIQQEGEQQVLFYQGVNILKSGKKETPLFSKIKSEREMFTGIGHFLNFFRIKSFSHMSTVYNRPKALQSGFYKKDAISADIFSFLNMCLQFDTDKVIISNTIAGVWVQHNNNISKNYNPKTHIQNLKLFKILYRIAINKGLNKLKCSKWLLAAHYYYLRIFAGKYLQLLKK